MQIHCYPHVSFFPSLNVIVWPYNNDWRTTVHQVVKSQTQLSIMMIYRRAWSLTALSWWLSSKESTCQCRRCGFNSWFGKIPWRRKWHPTPVFLPRKSHGQRSLAGFSLRGRRVRHSLATEYAHWHPVFLKKSSMRSPLNDVSFRFAETVFFFFFLNIFCTLDSVLHTIYAQQKSVELKSSRLNSKVKGKPYYGPTSFESCIKLQTGLCWGLKSYFRPIKTINPT